MKAHSRKLAQQLLVQLKAPQNSLNEGPHDTGSAHFEHFLLAVGLPGS